MSEDAFTLDALAAIIRARSAGDAKASYTKSLLDRGLTGTARKFGEEALELVIAAVEGEPAAVASEAADVLYHLLVVLESAGVPFADVTAELERRVARSGHEEKLSRPA